MHIPTLMLDGDAIEKVTWSDIRDLFPHYEEFWRVHLVPLRAKNSIQPRQGVDEDFEFLAMFHYSMYVHVHRAVEKSRNVADTSRFPDEIYLHLYAAAELGFKVVEKFNSIYEGCLSQKSLVRSVPLRQLKDRFAEYRNLVHEQLPAVGIDRAHRLMIPVPEKIQTYQKWTTVLYEARAEDFVDAGIQIDNDLRSLCSTLETAWKQMCKVSALLVVNEKYLERQRKGKSVAPLADVTVPPVSGVQMYSATAVSAVVSSGTDLDSWKSR